MASRAQNRLGDVGDIYRAAVIRISLTSPIMTDEMTLNEKYRLFSLHQRRQLYSLMVNKPEKDFFLPSKKSAMNVVLPCLRFDKLVCIQKHQRASTSLKEPIDLGSIEA